MPTVGEFCNRTVIFARRDEPVREAAKRMRTHHVGCLVIVDEVDGKRVPVGMLTDRDIVLGVVATSDRTPDRTTVGEVMASELLTMEEGRDLTDALMLMRSAGVRRIPVVNDDGGLEGIVAFDDFLEYLSEELGNVAALLVREQRRERESRAAPRKGASPG